MKDKEKQIEEMARVIAIDRYNNVSSLDTATMLYDDLDYRKIDKDSIVLSRKEYEVLKIKEKEKHWLETCMSVWENAKIDGSKETAEKIINFMKAFFDSWEDTDKVSKITMIGYLKAVAREFKVEI